MNTEAQTDPSKAQPSYFVVRPYSIKWISAKPSYHYKYRLVPTSTQIALCGGRCGHREINARESVFGRKGAGLSRNRNEC